MTEIVFANCCFARSRWCWCEGGDVGRQVLQDARLSVSYAPLRGANIPLADLRGGDSGRYRCTLNFNKKALTVEHTLLVRGE